MNWSYNKDKRQQVSTHKKKVIIVHLSVPEINGGCVCCTVRRSLKSIWL